MMEKEKKPANRFLIHDESDGEVNDAAEKGTTPHVGHHDTTPHVGEASGFGYHIIKKDRGLSRYVRYHRCGTIHRPVDEPPLAS